MGEIHFEITAKITVDINKWAYAFELPLDADAVTASVINYYGNAITEADQQAPGICVLSSQVHREA